MGGSQVEDILSFILFCDIVNDEVALQAVDKRGQTAIQSDVLSSAVGSYSLLS